MMDPRYTDRYYRSSFFITIDSLVRGRSAPLHFDRSLNRSQFGCQFGYFDYIIIRIVDVKGILIMMYGEVLSNRKI